MFTSVKFRLVGGDNPLILVPVHVNEVGPYEFVLDTGAGISLLAPYLAQQLRLESKESGEAQTAGGRVTVQASEVASLAIGAAKVEHVQVAIMDLSDLEKAMGTSIAGDIGYNYLKNFRVTVDYGNSTLRLARGQHETLGQDVLQEVEFSLAGPVKPLVLVPTLINGKGPHIFALDTGCSTTLISPELSKRLGISTASMPAITTGGGHTAEASSGRLDSVSVGGKTIQNIDVVVADVLTSFNQITGAEFEGIIGYNFLKHFRVTIDYPNQVLQLA